VYNEDIYNWFTARSFILIGFMGVGKTTVGHRMASKLYRDFIDIDHVIEKPLKGLEMKTLSYSKLFSTLGFQAHDIIFGIDSSDLQESELKKLASLAVEIENSVLPNEKYADIMTIVQNEQEGKISKLLLIADSITQTQNGHPQNLR
jgi:hypothetical protein